jgi:hypothetical protein
MVQQSFTKFGSLPADIRKDIWEMATRAPSIHFCNLSRGESDIVRMDDVTDKAYQEFLDLQGWDELSIDDREYKELKVNARAVSNYRASLVGLVPLEAGSGNTAPGEPSASWQLNDLATVCTESYQSVKWFIKNFPRDHRQVVVSQFSGAPRMTARIARFVRPQNIVCPRIPKPKSGGSAGFPVFEYTAFLPGTELDTFYEVAQAVTSRGATRRPKMMYRSGTTQTCRPMPTLLYTSAARSW